MTRWLMFTCLFISPQGLSRVSLRPFLCLSSSLYSIFQTVSVIKTVSMSRHRALVALNLFLFVGQGTRGYKSEFSSREGFLGSLW
ncbi:hypothetical protein BGZ61DRAFT_16349 [Ilyonectria robusta]|uniref:uncharacterized protein n=1 Tax=Ilyonectria robusta TaxID=1079257 RepID=UPI001E8DE78B|nr:uncharacterized protein BGZ61DRAFT_16349 [Ilyonectria robusta]KAH8737461.1 hypothetical protein BGZ61DRAFT_16349 [Ilyonectria robusta]